MPDPQLSDDTLPTKSNPIFVGPNRRALGKPSADIPAPQPHQDGFEPIDEGSLLQSVAKQKDLLHLVDLVEDLRAITTTTDAYDDVVKRYLEAVSLRGRLFGFAWIEYPEKASPRIVSTRFKNPTMEHPAMLNSLIASGSIAVQFHVPQILKTERLRGSLIACAPFFKDDKTTIVVCGLLHDDKAKCAEALMICQTIANHFDLWRSRDELTRMALEVRSTATVLELVGRTECSSTTKDACNKIANELQRLFQCDYVAVGLKQSSVASCKLTSVSAMAEFDQQSQTSGLFQLAFDEAILRRELTAFPNSQNPQGTPALAHKKLARHLRCDAAISIPVCDQNDSVVGAVTFVGAHSLQRNKTNSNLIRALEHPLGSSLHIVRVAEGGFLRRLQRRFVSSEQTNVKYALLAMTLIAVIAMFIPVTYQIPADCKAEPVIRSFSVAPYDGLLENTFVEPGDQVVAGQLLAKMDGRDLGFNIAQVVADRNKAAREYDFHLANNAISDSIQADLTRQGLEADLKVLEHQQESLEIRSGIAGIVLAGSLDRRENYPVTIGQTLFEIAPTSPLKIELAIPADEVMQVNIGDPVSFRFAGFGTQSRLATIVRIGPSSTIRNDENVFIAEVELPNDDGLVKPGMQGKAKVLGRRVTFGWSLFHRPWERVVTAIGF